MTIRSSTIEDLPRLMDIYREARQIQLDSGNLHQWKEGYPSEEIVREDISSGFRYCGIIHLQNGDPRLAYQKITVLP